MLVGRIKLLMIVLIALLPLAAGAAWYINNLQNNLRISQQNEAKLEIAVETNEQTIKQLREDYERANREIARVNNEFKAIERQNQNLTDKLADNDLGLLGEAKRGLVERVINNATEKAGRCFELLSGAELTEAEKGATNANQFNSECPWLYQPSDSTD